MGEKGPRQEPGEEPRLPFDEGEGKKKRLSLKEIAASQNRETSCPQCEIGGGTCSKHPVKGGRAA